MSSMLEEPTSMRQSIGPVASAAEPVRGCASACPAASNPYPNTSIRPGPAALAR
jgi:hypothetical protein